MARSLIYTIESIFSLSRGRNGSTYSGLAPTNNKTAYLEVPLSSSTFELPCFVGASINPLNVLNDGTEAIVVTLNTIERIPQYSTISAYMKEVLMDKFSSNRLVKLATTNSNNEPVIYYATFGAIFDDSFKPLLMCSWLVEKELRDSGKYDFKYIKPIIRVDQDCYLYKENPIEKFIAGKFLQTILGYRAVFPPSGYGSRNKNFLVEIAECPFRLKQSEVPSISTTNESLLKLAEEHLDEILE